MNKANLSRGASLLLLGVALYIFLYPSCKKTKTDTGTNSTTTTSQQSTQKPYEGLFSAQNAYNHIEKQISFGPRVPNTEGHKACGDWLVEQLNSYGAEVVRQEAEVATHLGDKLPITNIIASYNVEKTERILLLAHWDTRPKAENDPNPSLRDKPILGADDGGSGVAVLLEIARLMQETASDLPIDILLVDAEDSGEANVEGSWCLGSTYWSKNPHRKDYNARYGILLDMVGAKGATFRWEYFSKLHASSLLMAVWEKARQLGYGKYFIQADGAALTDDHIPIIENMGIPTIDIVNYDPARQHGFGDYWHTHSDTIEIISLETLEAVGNTLWEVLNSY